MANGLPVFDRLRYRRDDQGVFLYAFDLIELDGNDLRREPIERRKVLLIRLNPKHSAAKQQDWGGEEDDGKDDDGKDADAFHLPHRHMEA